MVSMLIRSDECFGEAHDVGLLHSFISDDVFPLPQL